MVLHEPFELEYWFVQVFSGGWDIFSLVSVLLISTICAKLKMPTSAFLIMIILFAGILSAVEQKFLIAMMILILAPALFWITRRLTE